VLTPTAQAVTSGAPDYGATLGNFVFALVVVVAVACIKIVADWEAIKPMNQERAESLFKALWLGPELIGLSISLATTSNLALLLIRGEKTGLVFYNGLLAINTLLMLAMVVSWMLNSHRNAFVVRESEENGTKIYRVDFKASSKNKAFYLNFIGANFLGLLAAGLSLSALALSLGAKP
jgi:hypothetical protein